jgi:hypothetical protein
MSRTVDAEAGFEPLPVLVDQADQRHRRVEQGRREPREPVEALLRRRVEQVERAQRGKAFGLASGMAARTQRNLPASSRCGCARGRTRRRRAPGSSRSRPRGRRRRATPCGPTIMIGRSAPCRWQARAVPRQRRATRARQVVVDDHQPRRSASNSLSALSPLPAR